MPRGVLIVYFGDHDPRGHVTSATPALIRWLARRTRRPVRSVISLLRSGHGVDVPGQRYRWCQE